MNKNLYYKNIISTALFQSIFFLTSFLIPKFILDFYGSEINGLLFSITQFVAYVYLIETGIVSATTYELYKPLAERDNEKISTIISTSNYLIKKMLIPFFIILIVFSILLPFILSNDYLLDSQLILLILIISMGNFLDFFLLGSFNALLIADKKNFILSIANIIQNILYVSIFYFFASSGYSIVFTKLIALLSFILKSTFIFIYVKSTYKLSSNKVKIDKNLLNKRWDSFYLQISSVFQNNLPIFLITILLDLKDLSIFAIYSLIVSSIYSIINVFTTSLVSNFGVLYNRKSKDEFKSQFKSFEFYYFLFITVIFSVSAFVFSPFIKLYTLGSETNYSIQLLQILFLTNAFINYLKTPYGIVISALGKFKETKLQTTFQWIIIIITGIPLTFYFKMNGVIISMLISNLYRLVDLSHFIPKYITNWSFKFSRKLILSSSAIFLISIFLSLFFPSYQFSSWLNFILISFILFIIISIFSILIFYILSKKNSLYKRN
jgi:O-antigen/teichoic acid export membrane protein